ncbi:hypothetical protein C8T65DRAFT_659281 [Cerioporus squamosus]|nr:hypothetical protein C8T65DRAFT_659281 [Cerioporus squamosus]
MCFCISSHDNDTHDKLSAALAVLAAGQQALAAVPIPSLPVVAGVLGEIIARIQKARTNHAALLTLSNQIHELANAIKNARDQVHLRIEEFPHDDTLRLSLCNRLKQVSTHLEPIAQLLIDLNALKDRANDLYQGPCLFRCLFSERDAQTLQTLQAGFKGALQLFQMQCSVVITKNVEAIMAITCAERDQVALGRLVHADPAFRTELHEENGTLLEGTRSALLADLMNWATTTTSDIKPICILTGCAGTGKTAIAMEVAHRLHQQGHLGASFAMVYADGPDCGSAFFSSLAYQMAHNLPVLRPHVVSAAILLSGRRCRTEETAQRLLEVPLQAAVGHSSPVVIVVDGLEECAARPDDPDMIQVLIPCAKKSSLPLRILLISRPGHSFETTLARSSANVHRLSLGDIPRDVVDGDIQAFLRSSLTRTIPGRTLLRDVPAALPQLVRQTEGWFLHARAALSFLNADPDHIITQLDILLAQGPSIRSGPLWELDKLYSAVLAHAFPRQRLDLLREQQTRLLHTLGYIALLKSPLTPAALELLSLIPCTDSLPILNSLRALVPMQRDGREDRIRPLHSSFRKFLLDPARCTDPLYLVNASACNTDLSECCLSTLTLLRPNVLRLGDPNVPRAERVGIVQRVKEYIPEHVQYACLYWADHLADASETERLVSGLATFSGESMKTWIESLAYMGRLEVAEGALAIAREWLNPERHAETRALLEEARQLVVTHSKEINRCPHTIYDLAVHARTGKGVTSFGVSTASKSLPSSSPPFSPPSPPPPQVSAVSSRQIDITTLHHSQVMKERVSPPRHNVHDLGIVASPNRIEQEQSPAPSEPIPLSSSPSPHRVTPVIDDSNEVQTSILKHLERNTAPPPAAITEPAMSTKTMDVSEFSTVKEASGRNVPASDVAGHCPPALDGPAAVVSEAPQDDEDGIPASSQDSPNVPPAPVETTNPRCTAALQSPQSRDETNSHDQAAVQEAAPPTAAASTGPGRIHQRPEITVVTSVPGSEGETLSAPPQASTPLSAQRHRPMQSM